MQGASPGERYSLRHERVLEPDSEFRFELDRRRKPAGPNELVAAATGHSDRSICHDNVHDFRRTRYLTVEDWMT